MVKLLLIESPGKIKTLKQILGGDWLVKASIGHIRELADDGDDALGFDLEGNQVTCRYVPRSAQAKQVLADLRQAVKQASRVYIATDPDREGETIGWHLQQELRLKQPHRVVYTEITPAAVRAAIAHPRQLDPNLIAAGRARDCLDKLVGYKGSKHVVWKLNIGAKSMGRVQSAVLHLLCSRELAIQQFQPQDYWSVWVQYQEGFKAFYLPTATAAADRETTVTDADQQERPPEAESARVTSQAEADRLVQIAQTHPHQVLRVEGRLTTQSPPPPFTTSTLQQAAGARLRFSPDQTMKVAQGLYEAGLITYMRTDSVTLSDEFCQAVRAYLQAHDPDNLPRQPNRHQARPQVRVQSGTQPRAQPQEAHEAIRPTTIQRTPDQAAPTLNADAARLYHLIWHRALASQCAPAQVRKTRIVTRSAEILWEARGQVVEFAGYTTYWYNLKGDTPLPQLQPHQPVTLTQAQADQKQTQPPPRYTEPKLVQLMERKGIGRPSTYAPTIKTLKTRTYVQVLKGALQPTALGLQLDAALVTLLPDLIEPDFTAQMEAVLDTIAQGRQDWQHYLTQWHQQYFAPALAQAGKTLGTLPLPAATSPTGTPEHPSRQPKPARTSTATSKVACPTCGQYLQKIPSTSKKLKANHFLKCATTGCNGVMFWNPQGKRYELPYAQRSPDPQSFTDIPCPQCGALLEIYRYQKDGQQKQMLRCSILDHRKGKCKDVAFFQTQQGFWSPKFGELAQPVRP